jgi:hypothetical protein
MTLPAEKMTDPCPDCEQSELDCDMTGCGGKYNSGFRARMLMSDSEKLTAILENQVWLTTQVAGLMRQFENHPMMRLIRGTKK